MKFERAFRHDMSCCKASRERVGLACDRTWQLCCAWHHAASLRDRGRKALQAFADQLLQFWPIADVHWVFNAAGEASSLAWACACRYLAMRTQGERDTYHAQLCAATPPEFQAVFSVLLEDPAALKRP